MSDALVQSARFQWEDGLRRLDQRAGDAVAPWRERVIIAVEQELRRRVGTQFSVADLAREHDRAGDWFMAIAGDVAPTHPEAWDTSVVLDAAFGRFARHAHDFHAGP